MTTLEAIAAARDRLVSEFRHAGVEGPVGEVNWTYDSHGIRVPAIGRADALVMGFNAGGGGKGSEPRWKRKCEQLTAGLADRYVLAELILLSSHDIGMLRQAHADLDGLVVQCASVNRAVIAYHRPTIVFQTGFDCSETVRAAYGLELVGHNPVRRPDHPTHALLIQCRMKDGTPWLTIRHPSSKGFSNRDLARIRECASGMPPLSSPVGG